MPFFVLFGFSVPISNNPSYRSRCKMVSLPYRLPKRYPFSAPALPAARARRQIRRSASAAGYRIARLTDLSGAFALAAMLRYGALGLYPDPHQGFHPWNLTRDYLPLTQIFMLRQALTGACLVVSERRPVTVSLALPPFGRVRLLWRQCSGTGLWGFIPIPTKGFTLGT